MIPEPRDSLAQDDAPPLAGPGRVRWWRAWRHGAALAWLWTRQQLRDRGRSEEEIDEDRRHFRAWLVGQVDEALEDGDLLDRWASR